MVSGRMPPLEPFEHYDHGKDADPALPDLFPKDSGVKVEEITPTIGAEVHGVQLSQLSNAGKDQLALFVAKRKLVGEYLPNLSFLLEKKGEEKNY
jgi:sulfonate dioxygenase